MSDERENMTEKQRRILDAATEVFAERGFSGASTSEIAKRAGVAEGTIFKHYKTKKDLLIGAIAPVFFRFVAPHLIEEVVQILRRPHPTFEDLLRTFFKNRIDLVRAHERVLRIALQEAPFHPEVRELAKKTIGARLYPEIKATIQRFQRAGQIREDVEPSSLVRMMVTTFAGYVLVRLVVLPEVRWDDEAEIEAMVRVLAQGMAPPAR